MCVTLMWTAPPSPPHFKPEREILVHRWNCWRLFYFLWSLFAISAALCCHHRWACWSLGVWRVTSNSQQQAVICMLAAVVGKESRLYPRNHIFSATFCRFTNHFDHSNRLSSFFFVNPKNSVRHLIISHQKGVSGPQASLSGRPSFDPNSRKMSNLTHNSIHCWKVRVRFSVCWDKHLHQLFSVRFSCCRRRVSNM